MTKHEFMARLASELHKRNVADAADVIEEYEQHFAFKLADGYSEEEIAAKLGNPEELAAQFESSGAPKAARGSRALTVAGLCFVDLFAGLFFVLLAAGILFALPPLVLAVTALFAQSAGSILRPVIRLYYPAVVQPLGRFLIQQLAPFAAAVCGFLGWKR